MQFFDNIPLSVLIVLCLLLGLAPFVPEPHIVEKLRMLSQGSLRKPIDIFDLFYHAAPFVLLVFKLIRLKRGGTNQ
ncbi:MAG: RND transporter [Proteobacteria bacterium]|nr:RND transporter [Pseudomonadota bacterium]